MSDIRQYRHFVALAEHGHFARAAEAVNLSQPALSRSIQALEANLGCRLIDRHSRGISLTAHGQLALEHARRLLEANRSLRNAVTQLDNLDLGQLQLGSGPYPAARLIPKTIGLLAQAHPRLRIELNIDHWINLRQYLLDERLELFIADTRELEEDPQLEILPLQQYPCALFCRPDHPALHQAPLDNAQLSRYAMAGTRIPERVHQFIQSMSGRELPLSIQCDNFMVLKTLVADSDVISFAPWDVIAAEVDSGRLALLPVSHEVPLQYSAYGLVSRAGHSLSPAAQALADLLQHIEPVTIPAELSALAKPD